VPLVFDVRDEDAVRAAAQSVRNELEGHTLSGLINNAGIGTLGPALYQPIAEVRAQLEISLVGVFSITQSFGPLLGVDRSLMGLPGRIINISSLAGKVGQPFAAAYSAAKHGLEGFSEALRTELTPFRIKVVIVGPALVDTPIWDKLPLASRYSQTEYSASFAKAVKGVADAGHGGLPPARVAAVVLKALVAAHPRLRYSPARHPLFEQLAMRAAPRRLRKWGFERALHLNRDGQ
jgi:NAD(P)-dependent dehydrogenase (short-subunit alcohol dehydrogenase family)